MTLAFRQAAAANDTVSMELLMRNGNSDFHVDNPGPKSGKTAAHVAAERANFKAIYWLFEQGANFLCKDKSKKTAVDYLQQKEFTLIHSKPMLKEDRKYYLCNAHFKIWFAHDPKMFMPYLYQEDFRQYRAKNPEGYISLVYSKNLLSNSALLGLKEFAKEHQITLISFEDELSELTEQFGTEEDKQCYQWALHELKHYPNQAGGNLAVVADLIRWSSVLLRKGNYSDTDVEIGQHKWTNSISIDKSFGLNLGSFVDSREITPWMNGDIIAASSLFPKILPHGDFRLTLSKTACFILKKVQSSLIFNCKIDLRKRIDFQKFMIKNLSNYSLYLKGFFKDYGSDRSLTSNFSDDEIKKLQESGLEKFSKEEKASIFKKAANMLRTVVEKEYKTPERAHQHSLVFRNVKEDEHKKFLMNYMQAIQMTGVLRNSLLEAI